MIWTAQYHAMMTFFIFLYVRRRNIRCFFNLIGSLFHFFVDVWAIVAIILTVPENRRKAALEPRLIE